MIPNFKTYIKESVWGDLHSRGIGELEREEDKGRINLLNKDEFFKYIKSNYEVFGTTLYKIEYTSNRFIIIPILKEPHKGIIKKIYIDLNFGIIDIYFWVSKPLEKLLKSKYKISKLAGPHWMIEQEEKDWNRINEFYIDVIDTLITFDPSVLRKKGINESIWGDLHSRGIGETEREEDDIDYLYNKDLCEYIKERYQVIFNRHFDIKYLGQSVITSKVYIPLYVTTDVWNPQRLISLVIFREPDDSNRTIEIHFRQKKHLTITFKYFFDKLKNEFDSVVKEGTVKISPKDGDKITNRFFINVLDFCIDNLEKTTIRRTYTAKLNITRKEVNENLWADLHSRGVGKLEREEDRIRTKGELIERMQGEYEKQNSAETHILDLTMLDVSLVEDMVDLFDGDLTTITTLDVSNWDVSNVQNMCGMFLNCDNLQTLDVSNWNVSNVKNMNHMFCNCENLQALDVSNWNVSNVKDICSMFDGCENLHTLDVSNWDVSNVKTMAYMFYNCESLQTLDVSNWNVSNVRTMKHMFDGCKNLQTLDVSNWKVSKVRTMNFMFLSCDNLQTLDVSRWNKEQQEQMPSKLRKVNENLWADLHSRGIGETDREEEIMCPADKYELIECIKQQYEKQGKGENLDLTMIDVSDVEDMRSLFECLFGSLNSWDNSQTIKHIDMSNWDVSHVKYMDRMFYGCGSIESLEVSDWDVSSVIHMSSMFQNCVNLESIDVSKWKMSSATNLYAMFFRCKKLKTLDVANWDVSHVEVMSEMFSGCEELESLDISNWKPNKLRSTAWMFFGCNKLQPVDVSKWDKSKQNKIPDRYKKITESVWADLHSRGIGETEREEDNVNLIDKEGLLDYLKSHYSIDGDSIRSSLHSIEVPVLKPAFLGKYGWGAATVSLDYKSDGKKEVTIFDGFPDYFEYVFKRLNKEYPIYHDSGVSFVIQPKSAKEECTNKFFIEVIDFIINTAKRELVIKKI